MRLYRAFLLTTILILFFNGRNFAQDAIFSQYYAAPQHVNPALTGLIDGSYRIFGVYRDQWKTLSTNPFVNLSVGGDIRFKFGKSKVPGDMLGGGISFSSNRVGRIEFSTNEMALNAAYHKLINARSQSYLSGGIKIAIVQRGISFSKLDFQDEFNGIDQFTLNTNESLPSNVLGYVDFSLGINYTTQVYEGLSFLFGASIHHLNQARTAFVDPNDPLVTVTNPDGLKLNQRLNMNLGFDIELNNTSRLLPKFLWLSQGQIQELRSGILYKVRLREKSLDSWQAGFSFDMIDDLGGYTLEGAALYFGVEWKAISFGLSYDFNIPDIQDNSSFRQRGFEITISYLGNYENDEFFCPTF